jgi:hypothetical protein
MAITIAEQPRALTLKGQKLIILASSNMQAQTGFKYLIEVDDELGNLIAKYYIPKNPQNRLVFDLSEVIREDVKVDTTDATDDEIIHQLPNSLNNFMSTAPEGCKKYVVNVGEVYGSPLVEYPNLATINVYLVDGYLQLRDGYRKNLTDYIANSSSVIGFLTNRQISDENKYSKTNIEINASEDDFGTLAFWNDSGAIISSSATNIIYRIYNQSGFVASENFTIGTTYGGANPASTTAEDKLIYFGAFPANVNQADHPVVNKPSSVSGWTYYTWQLGSPGKSLQLFIVNTPHPCKHSPVQVAWKNTLGAWDYFRFDARTQRRITSQSKDYRKTIGNYGTATTEFTFDTFDAQIVPYHKEAQLEYVLQSDWLKVVDTELLTNMVKSKNVMMYIDGAWLPIVVDSGSLSFEKDTISKRLVASVNVKLAQKEVC